MATAISFKPKQVSKRLLAVLPERARDVITKRFGLSNEDKMTLEAIGSIYGITRERVRQIENFALNTIRKSDIYEKETGTFDELKELVASLGGIVSEEDLLEQISKDKSTQNHAALFLVLGAPFTKKKEDADFKHRWIVDNEVAESVQTSLKKLYENLSDEDIVPEGDMITKFFENLKNISEQYKNEEIAKRWLNVSKKIGQNPLGEWGISESPNIKARGMRDYAFLVIRRHGSPMHFTEVAKSIEDTFGKKAHTATCHNELIKDSRFVLVGRGLYALTDWGYASGVVRDVIAAILDKNGPLNKDEIIEKVLNERYVKPNTIMVNLQNPKHFQKDSKGRYMMV
ncbi:sigma factor-like helix-turn-helix DNA-binding protein [Patescibacteria group bacterium]